MGTRLQRELERLADMDEANELLRERIERLEDALKPFADLSSIYVRRAETFGHDDKSGLFGATDAEMDRTITVGDCRRAIEAMRE